MTITCGDPPIGYVGVAYSHTFPVTDGVEPFVFSIAAGALPTGLTLGASTGIASGTPTTKGTFEFTVSVTDEEEDTAEVGCSITIRGKCLLADQPSTS